MSSRYGSSYDDERCMFLILSDTLNREIGRAETHIRTAADIQTIDTRDRLHGEIPDLRRGETIVTATIVAAAIVTATTTATVEMIAMPAAVPATIPPPPATIPRAAISAATAV
eukprot:gene16341-19311_t